MISTWELQGEGLTAMKRQHGLRAVLALKAMLDSSVSPVLLDTNGIQHLVENLLPVCPASVITTQNSVMQTRVSFSYCF